MQELRQAGLPVSLTENLDAMEAVKHIPIEYRDAFKYALAATLVQNNPHSRAFDTVYAVEFSLTGKHSSPHAADDDPLAQMPAALETVEAQTTGHHTGSRPAAPKTPEKTGLKT